MIKKTAIAAAIMGLGFCAGNANAASMYNKAGSITVTPEAGYFFFQGGRHMKNTLGGGAALGYNFTDSWGVEALAFMASPDSKQFPNSDGRVSLYSVNGLWRFANGHWFAPYLTFGLGLISVHPTAGGDAGTQANLAGGIGVQMFMDKALAWRFEYKHLYTMTSHRSDNLLTAGLSIVFGDGGSHATQASNANTLGLNNKTTMAKKAKPMQKRAVVANELASKRITVANFNVSSANINDNSHNKAHLDKVAKYLDKNPQKKVTLDGYTSHTGSYNYNQRLSSERAMNTKQYLVKHGIDSDRIAAKGKGWNDPIASNETNQGRAKNRRVDAIIPKG